MTAKQTLMACVALVAFVAFKAADVADDITEIQCGLDEQRMLTGWERSHDDP